MANRVARAIADVRYMALALCSSTLMLSDADWAFCRPSAVLSWSIVAPLGWFPV